MQKLVILGAGGMMEYASLIADINAHKPRFEVVGVLDDNPDLRGEEVFGVPVLGGFDAARTLDDCGFVFGIGSHRTFLKRKAILDRLGVDRDRFVSLIHPTARIYEGSTVGRGCIIHPYVVVFNGCALGDFTVVSPSSVIGANCTVGEGVLMASMVNITSGVTVGPYVHLGAGCLIAENITIGAGAQVAMGSLAAADLEPGLMILGNPGRVMKRREVPDDVLALAAKGQG